MRPQATFPKLSLSPSSHLHHISEKSGYFLCFPSFPNILPPLLQEPDPISSQLSSPNPSSWNANAVSSTKSSWEDCLSPWKSSLWGLRSLEPCWNHCFYNCFLHCRAFVCVFLLSAPSRLWAPWGQERCLCYLCIPKNSYSVLHTVGTQ